jgi:hypothetical protein
MYVRIRGVGAERQAVFGGIALYFRARAKYKRTYDRKPHMGSFRRYSAQTGKTCAARKIEYHGLRVIAGGMRKSYFFSPNATRLIRKSGVTHIARRFLYGNAARDLCHVQPDRGKGYVSFGTEITAKRLVCVRLSAAKHMVYVQSVYCAAEYGAHHAQKHERIRSAGKAYEHSLAL